MSPDTKLVLILRSYWHYHKSWKNQISHVFGIPIVMMSLWVATGWLRFGDSMWTTVAGVSYVLLALYYLTLDKAFAVTFFVAGFPFLYLSDKIARLPWEQSLIGFGILFVGGWIIQLVGHYFEGKKPALVDNFSQVFTAPLFLIAEASFALGRRSDLKAKVQLSD